MTGAITTTRLRAKRNPAGALTFAGDLSTQYVQQTLAAALSFVSALSYRRKYFRSPSSTLTFSGNYSTTIKYVEILSAALSFVGTATRPAWQYTLSLAGTLNFSAIAKAPIAHIMHGEALMRVVYYRALSSSMDFAGTAGVFTGFRKTVAAALSFSGDASKTGARYMRGLTGNLTSSGAFSIVTSQLDRALDAALSFAGQATAFTGFRRTVGGAIGGLGEIVTEALEELLTEDGELLLTEEAPGFFGANLEWRAIYHRTVEGVLSSESSFRFMVRFKRTVTGVLELLGDSAQSGWMGLGTLTFAGLATPRKAFKRTVTAVISPIGDYTVSRQRYVVALGGVLELRGVARRTYAAIQFVKKGLMRMGFNPKDN